MIYKEKCFLQTNPLQVNDLERVRERQQCAGEAEGQGGEVNAGINIILRKQT